MIQSLGHPLFADAIDIPFVMLDGLIVLVPLLAFEVFVEALVLKKVWRLPYWTLCGYTFFANILSLLAGIPTKIVNAILYTFLLPNDIPGFFARYPFVIAVGSLIYFGVTIWVEGAYAFRWRRKNQLELGRGKVWRGVLLANLATYIVLSPLNYFATGPFSQIHKFTNNTGWADHPDQRLLFVDSATGYLKSVRLNGSMLETIVPVAMTDYLVSSNLAVCLFRGTNGNLYIYRRFQAQPALVLKTDERFFMNQAAFSPSGNRVAFMSKNNDSIEVVDMQTRTCTKTTLPPQFSFEEPSVAWSPKETTFYIGGFNNSLRVKVTIETNDALLAIPRSSTNVPAILTCYGRIGYSWWSGGDDWGVSFDQDECADLEVMSEPGLDSRLIIGRIGQETGFPIWKSTILTFSVNPGLLHLAHFDFGDVAFVPGGGECLFESNGYIYLLDIEGRRIGTLVKGDRFIQLTSRYKKSS